MRILVGVCAELKQQMEYAKVRFFDIVDLTQSHSGNAVIQKDCADLVAKYASKKTEKKIRRFQEHSECVGQYKGKIEINPRLAAMRASVESAFRMVSAATNIEGRKKKCKPVSAKLTQYYTKRLGTQYDEKIANANA